MDDLGQLPDKFFLTLNGVNDGSHLKILTSQLKTYLQENLAAPSKVLEEAEYISPRTQPEGASALGLSEIIVLFGGGAGLSLVQQLVSLLVEWQKAKRLSSVSIDTGSLKITVSGASSPEVVATKILAEIEESKRKQSILRP